MKNNNGQPKGKKVKCPSPSHTHHLVLSHRSKSVKTDIYRFLGISHL